MKKHLILSVILILCFIQSDIFAQMPMKRTKFEEEDSNPSGFPYKCIFKNGIITDNGDLSYTFDFWSSIGASLIPALDDTYNVGERTTPLRWNDGSFAGDFEVSEENTNDAELHIVTYSGDADRYSRLRLRKSDHNTYGVMSRTDNLDFLSVISFEGVLAGGTWAWGPRIYARQSGNTDTLVPAKLYLEACSDTASQTNQVVLSDDGNVGIGTATPAEALHIKDGDLLVADDTPHIERRPDAGDAFEDYAYGNEWYFVNKTDSSVLWRVRADNLFQMYDLYSFPRTAPTDNYILKYDAALGRLNWEADAGAVGGDNVTVNGNAVDTTANIADGGDIDWTLTDGGAGGPDNITGTIKNDVIDTSNFVHNQDFGDIDTDAAGTLRFNLTGDVTSSGVATDIDESVLVMGGTDTVYPADPNIDGLLLWDDNPGTLEFAAIGAGLSYDGTTLTSSGSGAFSDAGDPIVQNTPGKDVHIGDGAGTLTGKLEIGGDADQPQLVIEGHSSQTDSLIIAQNDADTEVFNVDVDGTILTAVGIDAIGAVDMDYGTVDVTDHTFITDGTGDAEIVLPNDSIGNDELDWGSMTDLTTNGALGTDVVDEAHIADNGIDSEHYNDDSIDNAHINWSDIDYLGDEGAVDIAAYAAVGTFESGDTLLVLEAGVGIREADYDDLPAATPTAWDDIGNPDAADEIDFGAHIIELNVDDFRIGDGGANYWKWAGGAMTNAGTATINIAAANDLQIAGGQIDYDDMAGAGQIQTTNTLQAGTISIAGAGNSYIDDPLQVGAAVAANADLEVGDGTASVDHIDGDDDVLVKDDIEADGDIYADGAFIGALTGNVTGNCTGSSGSCTGNSATATLASTVTVSDDENTDDNQEVVFTTDNTNLESDGDFHYNPSSGKVTATSFAGSLTGNVTGDCSGSSGSCTGNAATCTTASAGDAAADFFGAGVHAVTDGTACTDIEGTLLSITGGTLNCTEAQDLSAVCTLGADYAGTITVNGVTMAANELITLGGQTLKHDGTDFITDDDITISAAGPDLSLKPTTGDTFGYHVEPSISQAWLSNETDAIHYIFFDTDHTVKIYDKSPEIQEKIRYTALKHFTWSVDPGSWYDSDAEIFCFEIGDDFPNGIIIDEWKTSCNCDPDVEITATLKYADDWINLANAVTIDTITTSTGTSSEDTDANINSGNAIPNGKVVYILFGADPEGTCVQWHGDIWLHAK